MANRLIRDGFVDSEAVCSLSDWAHRFYSNLLVKADDAGRFDGRREILRSHLFPLGTVRRTEDFDKALEDLESASLIVRYEFRSKPYIQVTKWQKCGRTADSLFPWSDGSYRISYVKAGSRGDDEKEFVTTSLLGPRAPGGDGVTTLNHSCLSYTETDTETKAQTTPAHRRTPEATRLINDLQIATNVNDAMYAQCVEMVEAAGYERAKAAITKGLKVKKFALKRALKYALGAIVSQESDFDAGLVLPGPGDEQKLPPRRKPTMEDVA